MSKRKTGTKEWAKYNKNIQTGCENGCLYCYACYNAVKRFHTVEDYKRWIRPVLNNTKYNETPRKLNGRIMYPTQHDITKKFLDYHVGYLKNWLQLGNDILITSKPDLYCIKTMCNELKPWKDKITFRFTIGSNWDSELKFWEPFAPDYMTRVDSLKFAFAKGFKTSISMEPFLDGTYIQMVKELKEYVTDTIWIGKMNSISPRVDFSKWTVDDMRHIEVVRFNSTDYQIKCSYEVLKDEPKIRWKDSIKKVLNLPDQEGFE